MPRAKLNATAWMDKEIQSAILIGQNLLGEKHMDTADALPNIKLRSYYRRFREPERFTVSDLRALAKRYHFTDRQICRFFGVQYHGDTPE